MTQSGVVLGCELLRGQGFPDCLLVSGSVEIESEDGEPKTLVVPPVSASWLALWSVQSQLNYMLHVVSSQAWCVLLFQSVRQSIIIHATLTLTLFFCSQWKSDLDCQGSRSQQDGWEYDFHQCDWILDRSLTCQCLGYWAAILWSVDMGHGNIAKPGTLSLGGIYQCDNHSVIVRVRT